MGSSRVASGTSGNLPCCLRKVMPPFMLRDHIGIPLQLLLGNTDSSRIEVEHSVVLSSCNRDLGVPIDCQRGSQALTRCEAWDAAFLSRCKRGVRPPVEFRRGLVLFLELQRVNQNSLHVVRGSLRFHSSWCRGIRPFLELRGNSGSFRLAAGTPRFLSTFNR